MNREDEAPSGGMTLDHFRARLRLLYARERGSRSKTGNPACTEAASKLAKREAGPEDHKQLAECRAMGKHQAQARRLKAAGQDAKAQHLEHRAKGSGPVSAKSRKAQAEKLKAAHRAKSTPKPPPPASPADPMRAAAEAGIKSTRDGRYYDESGHAPGLYRTREEAVAAALPGHRAAADREATRTAHAAHESRARAEDAAARKASPADRINLAINRAAGLRRRREAEGKLAEADVESGRINSLRARLDALRGTAAPAFGLKAAGPGASFANEGKGRTGTLFDEMKGAAARDLPGQTHFLGDATAAQMARHIPKVAGGSTAAIMDTAHATLESRRKVAGRIKALRERLRGAGRDPATHTEHAPGTVTPLATDLVHFDPGRFQYKMDVTDSKTGSVGSLAGVKKWNPELAGTISVWKDPSDGKTYVVNGHNRLDLARKLGVGRVDVRFLDASDAREARAKGALTNIAEGHGTSLDAAKFFRDKGITSKAALEDIGVPLHEAKAQQGLALAGLANPLFRRAIDGTLTSARGAIIGASGLLPESQVAVAQLAEKTRVGGREITDSHLKELVDEARSASTRVKAGSGGLFGDDPEEESLALHRSSLVSAVKERLGREKRLFGAVSRKRAAQDLARGNNRIDAESSGRISQAASEALDTFDRLKRSTGPVARALESATREMADAKGPAQRKAVQDRLYEDVLHAVQRPDALVA